MLKMIVPAFLFLASAVCAGEQNSGCKTTRLRVHNSGVITISITICPSISTEPIECFNPDSNPQVFKCYVNFKDERVKNQENESHNSIQSEEK